MADRIATFTPTTARSALERVRPAAERMCEVYRALERQRPSAVESDQAVDPKYFSLVQDLRGVLDLLDNIGVQVKDLKRGLVDFPARRAGRPVLLCWQVGEGGLGFWHDLHSGFAGRRPVDEDGPWEGEPEALELPGSPD